MKKRLCVFTVITSAIISFGFTSMAFADPEEKDVIEAGEVIVTATRYEETTSSVPASVTVITEKDIENTTARDIPDMLRTVAGIHVNDIASNQRYYTVDLRGFGETAGLNTLVLVDGRRTNQIDLSGTDWSQIPIENVARIEIIKGGRASVLYGDNAGGGVINIITKKGDDFKVGIKATAGSYDSYKKSAYLSGSINNFSYALTGNYYESDGYRDNSETRANDFGVDLGYLLSDIGALNLNFGYHKDNTNLPGALKTSDFNNGYNRNDTKNPDDYADTEDYYIKFSPEFYFLSDSMFKVDISYRNRNFKSHATGSWGYFDAKTGVETYAVNPQFLINEKIFGKQNTLIFGYDESRAMEDIRNTSFTYEYLSQATYDIEKRNYGIYVHDELMILEDLGFSAGYRYDRGEYDFNPSGQNNSDRKTFDEELYTAGINYRLSPVSNIYASFSRSFRYPVIEEMYSFFTNTVATGLSPQKSDDYEVGIRQSITDTLGISVSLFYIDTDDEIYFNPDSFANLNMDGDTDRRGVEITLKNNFKWGTGSIAYTYTKAEIDGGMYNNKDFPGVPKHQASATTIIDLWKPFTLSINANYIGKRPYISDFTNTLKDQDDYVVVNAKLKYKWKNVTTFLDINNLLDKEYEEYGVRAPIYDAYYAITGYEGGYYPSLGMNFMAGVSLDF